jgi:hypothetical protein
MLFVPSDSRVVQCPVLWCPQKSEVEEVGLKSFFNLLVVISLLGFTLACGLTGDTDGGKDSAAEAEKIQSDGAGKQEQAADDPEAATDEDVPEQGKDKSVTVRFGKGKTSGTYRDTAYAGTKHVYKFGVAQDQTISVKLDSNDKSAYLKVLDPSGEPIRLGANNTSFSESVPESGDYRIEVQTSSDRSDYTVTFRASALPADDDGDDEVQSGGLTKTVRFAKGRSSASYSGAVIRGERDVYVLGASGGQQMSVSISSEEDNAVFQVEGPGGYLRGAEPGSDRTSWSGELPANGKYRVIVGGTRGNATYTVTIAIR